MAVGIANQYHDSFSGDSESLGSYLSMDGGSFFDLVRPSSTHSNSTRSDVGYELHDISDVYYGDVSSECAEMLCQEVGECVLRTERTSSNIVLTVRQQVGHIHLPVHCVRHPNLPFQYIYHFDNTTRDHKFGTLLEFMKYVLRHKYLPPTVVSINHRLPLHPINAEYKKITLDCQHIVREGIINPNNRSSKTYFSGRFGYTKVTLVEKQIDIKVITEVDIRLKLGRHPNLVEMVGMCLAGPVYLVLTEEASLSLHQHVKGMKNSKRRQMLQICHDICCGMIYLHSLGCLHRSLHTRACIINKADTAKIMDLDKACIVDKPTSHNTQLDSVFVPTRWAAPEVLMQSDFSKSSDVWSFGVLVWEVFNKGQLPYNQVSSEDLLSKLKPGFRLELKKKCSVYDTILEKCLRYNRNYRPCFNFLEQLIQNLL